MKTKILLLSLLLITTFFLSSFSIYAQDESVVQGEAVQEEVMVEELAEPSFTQELKNRFLQFFPYPNFYFLFLLQYFLVLYALWLFLP
mgnify:CR=1 FL=1